MDVEIILVAFAFGFGSQRIGLPPLVGYLVAGFVLHGLGYETNGAIELIAEVGVLLLLFGIGLRLRPSMLARTEVWAVASVQMAATTAIIGGLFLALGALGIPLAAGLAPAEAALIGFAFDFEHRLCRQGTRGTQRSCFAVRSPRHRHSHHAGFVRRRVSGVRGGNHAPSLWALPLLIGIILARPIFGWFLRHSGHGELLLMLGLALSVGLGAAVFDAVGLKPDLGALIVGMTVAGLPKAHELSRPATRSHRPASRGVLSLDRPRWRPRLIGTRGGRYRAGAGCHQGDRVSVLLSLFRLRARTSLHTSLTLATYSEFGLSPWPPPESTGAYSTSSGSPESQWPSPHPSWQPRLSTKRAARQPLPALVAPRWSVSNGTRYRPKTPS